MVCMPILLVVLWVPLLQAADESDHTHATFIHSLGLCISGPTSGRTIELKSLDGEVIGRIEYEVCGNVAVCEPTGSIECLEVDSRFRRRGIGSCLFQTALDDMRNQGCRHVSWQATQASLPFYASQKAEYSYAEAEHHGMRIPLSKELELPASRFQVILNQIIE